jgi:hypothetical protein
MHVNLKYRRIESFKRYAVNTWKLGLVGLSAEDKLIFHSICRPVWTHIELIHASLGSNSHIAGQKFIAVARNNWIIKEISIIVN